MKSAIVWLGMRIPENLGVFVAAVFLSNSVNIFTNVYGEDRGAARNNTLLQSCLASLVAAALWTVMASKAQQIERATSSGSASLDRRESVRAALWGDVWKLYLGYLAGAVGSSAYALVVLVI